MTHSLTVDSNDPRSHGGEKSFLLCSNEIRADFLA
jgi:hypothetical protein